MSQTATEVPAALRLHVLEGPQAGKQLEKKGLSLRVGRTTKSALYIKDPAISEQHGEVVWCEGSWQLRDLGSTNGTSVNGGALAGEPSDWVQLKDGDLVKFGTETVVRVEVAAAASDAMTVEEYVMAECTQLEQRIRWARLVMGMGWRRLGAGARTSGRTAAWLLRPVLAVMTPSCTHPLCRARAEQLANQLRHEWKEQKRTLLMG
jgi:hypothetical protein